MKNINFEETDWFSEIYTVSDENTYCLTKLFVKWSAIKFLNTCYIFHTKKTLLLFN